MVKKLMTIHLLKIGQAGINYYYSTNEVSKKI